MFCISCKARKGKHLGIEKLFYVNRKLSTESWWTSDDKDIIMVFRNKAIALETMKRFKHNKPELMRYSEALKILENQIVETEE